MEIDRFFSDSGPLSKSLSSFEPRPQQIEMGNAVHNAFSASSHLAVEAGTGVGKSFAYLIPAIDMVFQGKGKVLISTFTITLQEQLIHKDIPFLAECIESADSTSLPNAARHFTAALAKGRANYLCKRRLDFAIRRQGTLSGKFDEHLTLIHQWSSQTKDGSLSDLWFVPESAVWNEVNSEHGNCRGRSCKYFNNCFYQLARRKLESADIIVANHALMFSDLIIKEQGASILPDYNYIIIDEAHNIEHVAEDHFGIDVSSYRIKLLLDILYNPRTQRGLLAFTKAEKAVEIIGDINKQSKRFFRQVSDWYHENKDLSCGKCYKNFVDDSLSAPLIKLRSELARMANATEDVDEKFELMSYVNRTGALVEELQCFLSEEKGDYVYWVEVGGDRRRSTRLRSAALNVGPDVKRTLFDQYKSVILTSATLSSDGADQKAGFNFFASRIGLEDFKALKLGSPFDYEEQVTIYIEKDMPNPNSGDFVEAAVVAIKKYLELTQGRAFVLFTSYQMLNKTAEKMSDWLSDKNIELLQQGTGADRSRLLEHFKKADSCVLFGTDSFWQGVDVPGEALSNVIIAKLPFAVPNQPLLAGRLEQIAEQGGNPFFDYQLPSAIIKFKQGFGRLIRTKTDKGIVVILDSRIVNKRYGQKFLSAIPKCKVEIV